MDSDRELLERAESQALRKLLNPPKTSANCRVCYPMDCICPDCADGPAINVVATPEPPSPTEGMTFQEIDDALTKGLMAMCPQCGVRVKTPLPEGWVWDCMEANRWAWCPKCNLHHVRAAASLDKEKAD